MTYYKKFKSKNEGVVRRQLGGGGELPAWRGRGQMMTTTFEDDQREESWDDKGSWDDEKRRLAAIEARKL